MKLTATILILCLLLTGCGASTVAADPTGNPTLPASEPQAAAQADFSFSLPDGYTIANATEDSCDIVKDGTSVGGFVRTGLGASAVTDPDSDVYLPYLETFVPEGLVYDYMAGHAEENPTLIDVALILVDPDTRESHEYMHYLFIHGDECYDLWLDSELVDSKDRCDILVTSGVDPNAEYAG